MLYIWDTVDDLFSLYLLKIIILLYPAILIRMLVYHLGFVFLGFHLTFFFYFYLFTFVRLFVFSLRYTIDIGIFGLVSTLPYGLCFCLRLLLVMLFICLIRFITILDDSGVYWLFSLNSAINLLIISFDLVRLFPEYFSTLSTIFVDVVESVKFSFRFNVSMLDLLFFIPFCPLLGVVLILYSTSSLI